MHSSVRRPITRAGARSSVAGSLAVRRVSWSAAVRSPGMMTPPMKRASAVTQSNVVAVPKSTTIVSLVIQLDRGERVHDPVGADAERLVHVEDHRQRRAGVHRTPVQPVVRAMPATTLWVTDGATDARHTARTSLGEWPARSRNAADGAAPLVRGPVRIGREPPVGLERRAAEQARG